MQITNNNSNNTRYSSSFNMIGRSWYLKAEMVKDSSPSILLHLVGYSSITACVSLMLEVKNKEYFILSPTIHEFATDSSFGDKLDNVQDYARLFSEDEISIFVNASSV